MPTQKDPSEGSTVPTDPLITRRDLLAGTAVAVGALSVHGAAIDARPCPLGLASNVFDMRRAAQSSGGQPAPISDPVNFLNEARELGAAGIQGPLGVRDEGYTRRLRKLADDAGLFIEASVMPPHDDSQADRFENELKTAKAAGVTVARTVLFPGRRYEQFNSADEFARATKQAYAAIERAEPIARKHGVRLAIENHKDQRVPERIALLKRIGSEYVGACMDIGNSFALCEDPLEVAQAYAPFSLTAHVKNQAVREYEDGFFFADAPLGKGFLAAADIVRTLRAANPHIRLNLEVMTRDPLRVPVLTRKYWCTMPDVPAADLARTLRFVKAEAASEPLPLVSTLSPRQRAEVETRNITESLAYAREHLRT
jgi:sugar phosphate isomerase/epimerase